MSLEQIITEINTVINTISNADTDNFTKKFIEQLFYKYDTEKVVYCLKSACDLYIDNITSTIARNDVEFRNFVINRFSKCIICQNNECVPECCEVAHILEFAVCDELSKYDVNNGLLLCANTHRLFDSGLLKLDIIDADNALVKIIIDVSLWHCNLYKYNGIVITLFRENIQFIEKRYQHSRFIFSC